MADNLQYVSNVTCIIIAKICCTLKKYRIKFIKKKQAF